MSATVTPPPPTPSAPPAAPARSGEIHDAGAVRRDSVRALRWTSTGASKILGDVEVDDANLAGLISIRGNVTGGSVAASGTLDIGGFVRLTGTFRTSGTTKITQELRAADLDLAGATSVGGAIAATGRARWKGTLETTAGVTADRVEFEGRAAVDGAVVAKTVDGRLRDDSRIGSIAADTVRLVRPTRLFGSGHLEVLTIEAREAELEGVHAQYVKAEKVILGPGCQVAQVDGTITRQHATSHVGPESKTPRPYGLMR